MATFFARRVVATAMRVATAADILALLGSHADVPVEQATAINGSELGIGVFDGRRNPCAMLLVYRTPGGWNVHVDTLRYEAHQKACQLPGPDLLRWLVGALGRADNVEITLQDDASRNIHGTDIRLTPYRKLNEGRGWYESFGFVAADPDKARAFQATYDHVRNVPADAVAYMLLVLLLRDEHLEELVRVGELLAPNSASLEEDYNWVLFKIRFGEYDARQLKRFLARLGMSTQAWDAFATPADRAAAQKIGMRIGHHRADRSFAQAMRQLSRDGKRRTLSQTDLEAREVPESLREFNLVAEVLEDVKALETPYPPYLLRYDPAAETADATTHGRGVTLAQLLRPTQRRTSTQRGRALKADLEAAIAAHRQNAAR